MIPSVNNLLYISLITPLFMFFKNILLHLYGGVMKSDAP
jgi:hypothetical protein